jgi:hypothetical protein
MIGVPQFRKGTAMVMVDLDNYKHRQPLDRTHVHVVCESCDPYSGEYVEQLNYQAAMADCSVPTTGQGRVETQDPDLILLVDQHSGHPHFQRATVLFGDGILKSCFGLS